MTAEPAPEPGVGVTAFVMGFVVSDLTVVILVLASVAGVVFDRPALTAVGTLVLVLALLCRVWARHAMEHVSYRCEPDAVRVMEGDPVTLVLVIENRKALPVPWLRVREQVPPGLELIAEEVVPEDGVPEDGVPEDGAAPGGGDGSPGGALLLTTTALGSHERVRLRFRLRALRRGRYVFGPARLTSGDPFGFYENERVVMRTVSTLAVLPRMPALPGVALRLSRPVGDRARRLVGPDDPTLPVTARAYRRGDPLRRIDWKVSARRGAPHVRVNDISAGGAVLLLLECDTRITGIWDASPQRVDQVVRIAAALARDLLAVGLQVGLLSNGVPPGDQARLALAPGAGRGQLASVLDALARVQPVVVKPLSALFDEYAPQVIGFGTAVVCVAAVLQPDTRALLGARRRSGLPATLVHVTDGAPATLAGVRTLHLDPALAAVPA